MTHSLNKDINIIIIDLKQKIKNKYNAFYLAYLAKMLL